MEPTESLEFSEFSDDCKQWTKQIFWLNGEGEPRLCVVFSEGLVEVFRSTKTLANELFVDWSMEDHPEQLACYKEAISAEIGSWSQHCLFFTQCAASVQGSNDIYKAVGCGSRKQDRERAALLAVSMTMFIRKQESCPGWGDVIQAAGWKKHPSRWLECGKPEPEEKPEPAPEPPTSATEEAPAAEGDLDSALTAVKKALEALEQHSPENAQVKSFMDLLKKEPLLLPKEEDTEDDDEYVDVHVEEEEEEPLPAEPPAKRLMLAKAKPLPQPKRRPLFMGAPLAHMGMAGPAKQLCDNILARMNDQPVPEPLVPPPPPLITWSVASPRKRPWTLDASGVLPEWLTLPQLPDAFGPMLRAAVGACGFDPGGKVQDVTVEVDQINFSQNSCGSRFSDGRQFEELMYMLHKGVYHPYRTSWLCLECWERSPEVYESLNNRRLYCLKKYKEEVKLRDPSFQLFCKIRVRKLLPGIAEFIQQLLELPPRLRRNQEHAIRKVLKHKDSVEPVSMVRVRKQRRL